MSTTAGRDDRPRGGRHPLSFIFAHRAEAQDFKVNARCYLFYAWLDWRLNVRDPTQIRSALLQPEPICNHIDMVANESDPDLFRHFIQNVDVPSDNLLDHSQLGAGVDGIPGSSQLFELLELGYPVSSPSVVEPAGDLVSVQKHIYLSIRGSTHI